jgi:FtsP/CotA-like multicopper oxidase with cupredoxin domain
MSERLSRRDLLGFGGAAAVIGLGVGLPFAWSASAPSSTGSVLASLRALPPSLKARFRVPPVAQPVEQTAAADVYELTQRDGTIEIFPGVATAVRGYDGLFPGPTIETRRGRPVEVRQRNRLDVPTVTHLHGGRTPASSDGYPTDLVPPGSDFAYHYPLDQRAATLWYHDHRMDFTGPAVWRGLAGMHVHRDDEEDALGLPSGDRDLPIMIMDRSFDAAGQLRYPSLDPELQSPGVTTAYNAGVLGDVLLVNGAPWPVARVVGARYRLRLLNASNARRYRLRLDAGAGASDDGFTQIGSDGGLLATPRNLPAIEIAPAERFDVVVDFARYAPGTRVTLVNEFGDGATGIVMAFEVGDRVDDASRVPDRLAEVPKLDPDSAVRTRTMTFRTGDVHGMGGWTINGAAFDPARIDAEVRLGTTEIWRLVSDFHHPIHLHLSPFQVIGRGIGGPGEFDAGWKDTVDVRPSEEVTVAIPFDGYPGRYVFHCHNLEHEDMAMMANLVTH